MPPIVIVPYDPSWPEMFERERVAILSALGDLDVEVEHIGSTSVPGLAAKPKIDIMVGLTAWKELDLAVDRLLLIGYEHEPQFISRSHHLSLRRGRPTTHRVHIVERAREMWNDDLSFRDTLRDDADLAARYGALKKQLASRHREDPQTYWTGKGPFIESVTERVRGAARRGATRDQG